MTTHISTRATADKLVTDYMALHETANGMCAGLDVMHHDNEGIEDVRDSAIRAEETGEIRRLNYRGDK